MVGTAVLCHGTLAVDQEAVPAAFLRQSCLVSLSNEGVQLSLLTADGLHKLIGNTHRRNQPTGTLWLDRISAGLGALSTTTTAVTGFTSEGPSSHLPSKYYKVGAAKCSMF